MSEASARICIWAPSASSLALRALSQFIEGMGYSVSVGAPDYNQPPHLLIVDSIRSDVPRGIAVLSLDALQFPRHPIITRDSIRKSIQTALDPIWSVEPGKRVALGSITVQISTATAIGFVIQAPLRIAPGENVELSSRFLRNQGLSEARIKRTHDPCRVMGPGRIFQTVEAVGVPPELARHSRARQEDWK